MSVVITASSSFSPVTWKQSLGVVKKGVLRDFAGKPLCQCLFFKKVTDLRPATLLKETLAQVFSCEFCEISKNTHSYGTPPVAASAHGSNLKTAVKILNFTGAWFPWIEILLISLYLISRFSDFKHFPWLLISRFGLKTV